ncbi:MAG: fructosamine kinase family protein [Flavobacteriaceae bacterium]
MDSTLQHHLSALIGSPIQHCVAVTGGDIAQAYRISTATNRLFCKLLQKADAISVFQAEADGLNAIAATKTIRVPEIHFCEPLGQGAVLIMEFVETKRPTKNDMANFGRQLALLHKQYASSFGWASDNFIGSLSQSNKSHETWPHFYVKERLVPQLNLAVNRRLLEVSEIPSADKMIKVLIDFCPAVRPSLVHGDLWSGNYLVRMDGTPFLIDPAIYYGHSEVDIAMSMLFGGFGDSFYSSYEKILPMDHESPGRLKIYQLYYLLVHLNLFGSSYYSGVKAILKSYF